MRHFFDRTPATWAELEDMVTQAFREMKYETTRNMEVATVRGAVRIDVHAVKKSSPIPTVVLCECKHWAKAVDQNVVHAFRTVCADTGAHYGLIISKEGFQKGAELTRDRTNIHLMNFSDFQETFFDEWRTGVFMDFAIMSQSLNPLIISLAGSSSDRTLAAKLKDVNVFEKYEIFMASEISYSRFFIQGEPLPQKLRIIDPRGDPRACRGVIVDSYRAYLDLAKAGFEDTKAYFGL